MPLTPEEIKAQRFPVGLRGYDRDEVDGFLERVAADYEAAIAAIASAADPYGSVGREVSNVLRTAKESAEKLRRDTENDTKTLREQAAQEAAEMRRRAAEEAAATLEQARETAVRLTNEAERHSREATQELDVVKQRASDEAEEIRRRAAEEAAATLDAATSKAEHLTHEAQRRARELQDAVERRCDEMLEEAARRQGELQRYERELHERVDAIESALGRLRSELRAGNALPGGSASKQTSPAVAERLRALEPDLGQVASALVEEEPAADVIRVDEPQDGTAAAQPARGKE